jgi:N-acetylmuramic acid 6-phosphate etherase
MAHKTNKALFEQLEKLATEQRNPRSMGIDLASASEIVDIIHQEDRTVADAVARRSDEIALAIEMVREALSLGGRLIYTGAGTSGRIGVVDASECPPTFGSPPSQVLGVMAGGRAAMFEAQEAVEDSPQAGKQDMEALHVCDLDVVCGLAASGRTPYVHGTLEHARQVGARSILICCVPREQLHTAVTPDLIIDVAVGPEVIMGSTRMKSGTAQKMVCNMITTGAFIRLGKVYENVMVDLQLTNEKLQERSRRILMMLTGCDYERATELLIATNGHVKTAMVMEGAGVELVLARELLQQAGGFVRKVIDSST